MNRTMFLQAALIAILSAEAVGVQAEGVKERVAELRSPEVIGELLAKGDEKSARKVVWDLLSERYRHLYPAFCDSWEYAEALEKAYGILYDWRLANEWREIKERRQAIQSVEPGGFGLLRKLHTVWKAWLLLAGIGAILLLLIAAGIKEYLRIRDIVANIPDLTKKA